MVCFWFFHSSVRIVKYISFCFLLCLELSHCMFAFVFVPAGTIAKLWSSCRDCTSSDVIQCMQTSALDKGQNGRDDEYGYGIPQLDDAFVCLTDDVKCCSAPGPSPTLNPSSSPVGAQNIP